MCSFNSMFDSNDARDIFLKRLIVANTTVRALLIAKNHLSKHPKIFEIWSTKSKNLVKTRF